MRRPAVLLAVIAAVAQAGCSAANPNASAGDFEGAERDVAQVVDDLKSSRDSEKICSRILTDDFARSLEAGGRDCVEEVQATIRDVADTDLEVREVTVSGGTARAEVRQAGDGGTATFELARGADGWQISSFGQAAGR